MPAAGPFAFAFGVSYAALALSAAVVAALAALRGLRRWRSRRLLERAPAWREALGVAIADPAAARLPPIAPPELASFLAIWNEVHDTLEGTAADNLEALLRLHGFDQRLLRLLRRPSPRLKLVGITALGRLREQRAWSPLLALAESRGALLSFAAARALLRIDAPRALESLGAAFCVRHDWPLARVGSIFQSLGPEVVTRPLLLLLTSRPRSGLDRAVQLARFGQRGKLAPVIRDWLGAGSQPELIVAALEYAQEPEDLPWVRTVARHGEWRVRADAALALGRVGGRGELPLLLELLRDPVWRVRYRASQALIRLQGLEPHELDALRDSERDAFAADMLAQALAESGIR